MRTVHQALWSRGRCRSIAVAVLALTLAGACSGDDDPVAAGGATTIPGEAPADVTTTTSRLTPTTASTSSTAPSVPSDGSFDATLTTHCIAVADGIDGLPDPETVGDARAVLEGGVQLHDAWLVEARRLDPPGVDPAEWTAHLDRIDAALREVEAFTDEITAGRADSDPVEPMYAELDGPRAIEVDEELDAALRAVNELVDLDCFHVSDPESEG